MDIAVYSPALLRMLAYGVDATFSDVGVLRSGALITVHEIGRCWDEALIWILSLDRLDLVMKL